MLNTDGKRGKTNNSIKLGKGHEAPFKIDSVRKKCNYIPFMISSANWLHFTSVAPSICRAKS